MRLLTALTGGLLGALPGLLLYTAGVWITDGGDGMIPFGLGGLALIAVGVVAGLVLGWRTHGRFANQGIAVGATGLAAVLAIVGLTAFSNAEMSSPDARDCLEVYEMLGATRETPEIRGIPPLTPSQTEWAEQQLARLEEESPNDPFCDRLREDLEAQR